jgi:hypothetical protein
MASKKGFGNEFEKAWSEGMNNNDWTSLNDVIMKSVDSFLDGIGDKLIKGKLNVVSEMEKNASRIQKSIDKTMAELNG